MNWKLLLRLAVALAVTLLAAALFLLANGYSPWLVAVTLVTSAWGSPTGVMQVLTKTSLLILTGLAVALPYRAGLFNIGGEGQMYAGGLTAAVVGTFAFPAFGFLHLTFCLLCGTFCGALWAGIAALLKNYRGIHEVISTIMLNFIAFQIVNELTFGALNAGAGSSRTPFIRDGARMPILWSHGAAETSWGIILSIAIALTFAWTLRYTWLGFGLRATGSNPKAALYSGLSPKWMHGYAMLLGGGCAGLAGAIQTTAIDHTFYARFAAGYGFDGIAVAFLALCEPWAVIPAAAAIATLRAADRSLQLDAGIPKEMVFVLEGLLIISIAVFSRWRTDD